MRLRIDIGDSTFEIETDRQLSEIRNEIDRWYAALPGTQQKQIDAIAARLKSSNDKLVATVAVNTPK